MCECLGRELHGISRHSYRLVRRSRTISAGIPCPMRNCSSERAIAAWRRSRSAGSMTSSVSSRLRISSSTTAVRSSRGNLSAAANTCAVSGITRGVYGRTETSTSSGKSRAACSVPCARLKPCGDSCSLCVSLQPAAVSHRPRRQVRGHHPPRRLGPRPWRPEPSPASLRMRNARSASADRRCGCRIAAAPTARWRGPPGAACARPMAGAAGSCDPAHETARGEHRGFSRPRRAARPARVRHRRSRRVALRSRCARWGRRRCA